MADMTEAVSDDIRPTAVVVEDDLQIRAFVSRALVDAGWNVVEMGAIDDAWLHLPDLFVLDLGLPTGDCVGFIAAIRQRSRVPIIVMTGRVDASEKMRALAAGANDYVSKLFGIGARFSALLQRFRPHPTGEYQ
jgi:two-component system KDP operon response regulator KdpE